MIGTTHADEMKTHWVHKLSAPFVLAGFLLLSFEQTALAARAIRLEILLEGEVVASGLYTAGDRTPPEVVWRYLKEPPGFISEEDQKIKADESNPLRAALTGNIEVRLRHVERVLASAKVTHLSLVRPEEARSNWHLPEAEVERLAQIAGLPTPATRGVATAAKTVILVSALLGILLVGGLLFWLIRRISVS